MTTQATARRHLCKELMSRQLCLLQWLETEVGKLPPVEQSPQAIEITKAEVAKTKRLRALGPVKAKAKKPAPGRVSRSKTRKG